MANFNQFCALFVLLLTFVFAVEINENKIIDELDVNSRIFETEITNMVECIRQRLKNGIPSLGISSLDPLKFPIIPLVLNNNIVTSTMLLTSFNLEGLAGFEQTEGKITTPLIPVSATLDFGLKFDKIKMFTNYRGKMKLFDLINLHGKGKVSMDYNNFDFKMKVVVKVVPTRIDKFSIKVTLPSTVAVITGLFNDEYMSELVSRQMTDTFTMLAKEENERFNEQLNYFCNTLITNVVNPMIRKFSIQDLIHIITGSGGSAGTGFCDPAFNSFLRLANEAVTDVLQLNNTKVDDSYIYMLEDDFDGVVDKN